MPARDGSSPVVKHLGHAAYVPVWRAMQGFTSQRGTKTADEVWVVEHSPVFTLGLNGKREHILHAGDIPVVQSDRGGQVTYHGPGQLVIYLLIDLRRAQLGARGLVSAIENAVIALLVDFGVVAQARRHAPGVYVEGKKIAALGLRIRRGCSYHGLALNVDMDLAPFARINPCGYAGLQVTQVRDHVQFNDRRIVANGLCNHLLVGLGYNDGSIEQAEINYVLDPAAHRSG
ncbi:MAG: lipoyl(octanoyl) transferase LipB [Gammaproteobacteria bacterium]|nr:lipoyl(octanoyl) transferase LipB [Gammaproteobacteria bacterium]